MTDYPWYEEVAADAALLQGDLIEGCPVIDFRETRFDDIDTTQFLDALARAAVVETVRSIVMTQACDLQQGHVQNVILCPVYHLDDYRRDVWELFMQRHGQVVTEKAWRRHADELKQGKIWNLTMLDKRDRARDDDTLVMPHQVVDFHEVFNLPVSFLSSWLRASGARRLRLQPPYREHLSQSFARFFMRVGLPVDITDV